MLKPLELHSQTARRRSHRAPDLEAAGDGRFYRDILGLPLVHGISAKGWGREKEDHADFLHFFFDSGNESTIAILLLHRHRQPPELEVPKGYMAMANHTAWRVQSEDELLGWQRRL